MRRVIIESPFSPSNGYSTEVNVRYARACVRDSVLRGEAPIASHLLLTQPGILDDTVPEERALGIEAGLVWGEVAKASIFYTDLGFSAGMRKGEQRARYECRPIEYRTLPTGQLAAVFDGAPVWQ